MELLEVVTILIPIAALVAWNRSEANADRREAAAERAAYRKETADERKDMTQKIEAKIEANMKVAADERKDMSQKIETHMKEMREIITAIQMEIKDFHGRLCAIEANRKTIILNKEGHPHH